MKFLTLILVLSLNSHALESHQACEQVFATYTSCGETRSIKYDGVDFLFGNERVKCSDGRELDFYSRMEHMDVSSILDIPYEVGAVPLPEQRRNWDPGRLRVIPLLKSVYGRSEGHVRENLIEVEFLGQMIKFQSKLGAATALYNVGQDLIELVKTDESAAKFLHPFISGEKKLRGSTFYWRLVAGTDRLSMHSFGAAIDLLADEGPQYWLWDEKIAHPEKAKLGEAGYIDHHYIPTRRPLLPQSVVNVFERNGFIWGGKWNHYDTMHFEYRPEFFELDDLRHRCGGGLYKSQTTKAPLSPA